MSANTSILLQVGRGGREPVAAAHACGRSGVGVASRSRARRVEPSGEPNAATVGACRSPRPAARGAAGRDQEVPCDSRSCRTSRRRADGLGRADRLGAPAGVDAGREGGPRPDPERDRGRGDDPVPDEPARGDRAGRHARDRLGGAEPTSRSPTSARSSPAAARSSSSSSVREHPGAVVGGGRPAARRGREWGASTFVLPILRRIFGARSPTSAGSPSWRARRRHPGTGSGADARCRRSGGVRTVRPWNASKGCWQLRSCARRGTGSGRTASRGTVSVDPQ
jgi:hypothetical protein